jgi:dTDP-4-amino-4,6-dideoxygalactose transaminase
MITYANLLGEYKECQQSIDAAIARTIANSSFINGPEVRNFEQDWAAHTNSEDCAGVSSGTSALMLALDSLGIGPGDEVIVPAMSFIATAEVVDQLGATPVFVDIDLYHTLDIPCVKQYINERTRAVIFVDLYGQTVDIHALKQEVGDLPLIRDAAQSAGCEYLAGNPDQYLYATCWSFYPGKNLSGMGDAGAVTGSEELCARIRYLRDHGRTEKYVHTGRGWNERLDGMQAAIIHAKIPFLRRWNQRRQHNANIYRQRITNPRVGMPMVNPASTHVYNQFVIKISNRDALKQYLADNNIESGLQFPLALHEQPVYKERGDVRPIASILANRCLSLPVHPYLTDDDVAKVAFYVQEFADRG